MMRAKTLLFVPVLALSLFACGGENPGDRAEIVAADSSLDSTPMHPSVCIRPAANELPEAAKPPATAIPNTGMKKTGPL